MIRHFILALALAASLLAGPIGCASRTVQAVATEEGVTASPELRYYGVLADYVAAKQDAFAYSVLPSTSASEVERILLAINGGTDDTGCEVGSAEPRCLDGGDGVIRSFEAIRRLGGVAPNRFESVSIALAAAAAQLRASGAGGN